MNLKKAEADLASANQERAQLKLAAERQRGPWFDEVRASVEERVRQALSRAEALESEMEVMRGQQAAQLQELGGQKADLEEFVAKLKAREEQLEKQVAAASAERDAAEARAAAAQAALDKSQAAAEELGMRNSVLQDNVKQMRQECQERYMSEQAALSKLSAQQGAVCALESTVSQLQSRVSQLESELGTQLEVNRQLMRKKEQTEWELMAALAKAAAPGADGMMKSASKPPQFSTPSRPAVHPALAGSGNQFSTPLQAPAPTPAGSAFKQHPGPPGLLAAMPAAGAGAAPAALTTTTTTTAAPVAAGVGTTGTSMATTADDLQREISLGVPVPAPSRERADVHHTPLPQRPAVHMPRPYASPKFGTVFNGFVDLDPPDEGVYSAYVFDLKCTARLASPISPMKDPHPVMNVSQEVARSGPLPAPLPSDIAADPDRKTVDITATQPINTVANLPAREPSGFSSGLEESEVATAAGGGDTPQYIVSGTGVVPLAEDGSQAGAAPAVPTATVLLESGPGQPFLGSDAKLPAP